MKTKKYEAEKEIRELEKLLTMEKRLIQEL